MSDTINRGEHAALTKQLMAPFAVKQNDGRDIAVLATPIVTSKGRLLLTLQSDAYLTKDEATLLRNWLSDWVGHTDQIEKGGK